MDVRLSTIASALAALMKEKNTGDLVELVLAGEDAGRSWRDIAFDLYDATGIRVSHESVRTWARDWRHQTGRPMPDPDPAASAA